MNPISMKSDLDWLESHVRTVYGGVLPPLVGPYAVPFIVAQHEGIRKHLPLILVSKCCQLILVF